MVIVAVAGGTGGVGGAIVKALEPSKHTTLIFTRKEPSECPQGGLQYVKVDYNDVDSLARTLEEHNVQTVVSALNLLGGRGVQSQLNLIEAAKKTKATTRFIPSEFAHMATREEGERDPAVAGIFQSADILKASDLKYTRFINGFLMDYWGMPHIPTTLSAYSWGIDVESKQAAIPGTGNEVISLAYSADVAELLVRLLDEEDWPEYSLVSGSDITFNEMLAQAEKVRGSKFDVKYDSKEELEKGNASILVKGDGNYDVAELKELGSLFGLMAVAGSLKVPTEGRLSERFPDVHLLTFGELLEKYWAGK